MWCPGGESERANNLFSRKFSEEKTPKGEEREKKRPMLLAYTNFPINAASFSSLFKLAKNGARMEVGTNGFLRPLHK